MIRSHQEKIVKYALKILNFNSQRIIQGKKMETILSYQILTHNISAKSTINLEI